MSCANILASALNRGTVCSDDLFTAFGSVTATGTTTFVFPAPFAKSTDVLLWGLQCGAVAVGALPVTVQNSGLANATFTVTPAGGITANSIAWYMVIAGETA